MNQEKFWTLLIAWVFVGNLSELLLIPLESKWWAPNSHLALENWENYFPLKECLFSEAVFVLGSLYDTFDWLWIFQSKTICLTFLFRWKRVFCPSLWVGESGNFNSVPYVWTTSGGWLGLWQHDLDGSLNWWTDGPAFRDQLRHETPQKNRTRTNKSDTKVALCWHCFRLKRHALNIS